MLSTRTEGGEIAARPMSNNSDVEFDGDSWFLDGQWIDLDARHNYPRLGRILMATGRDAADVAITTSFWNN